MRINRLFGGYYAWHDLVEVATRLLMYLMLVSLGLLMIFAVLGGDARFGLPHIPLYVLIITGFLFWLSRRAALSLPRWLPAYLYLMVTLGVPLSRSDARKASFLFDGRISDKPISCWFIHDLHRDIRLDALKHTANLIAQYRLLEIPFPEPAETDEARIQRGASRTALPRLPPVMPGSQPEPELDLPDSEELLQRPRL